MTKNPLMKPHCLQLMKPHFLQLFKLLHKWSNYTCDTLYAAYKAIIQASRLHSPKKVTLIKKVTNNHSQVRRYANYLNRKAILSTKQIVCITQLHYHI